MSTLRISDAPLLPDVDGTEKLPTGGRGDYAISVDQIKDHIFQDVGKELVGLGNVDNTSDLDKPISTAQQSALNLKADKTYVDSNLDLKADKTSVYTRSETSSALSKKADLVNGVVPENQIPSSFNDVLEFTTSTLPILGESGKIYVTTDNNRTWRWGGNKYVEISGWNPDSVSKSVTIPTYSTKEAGVAPITGVTEGAYFNVRSSNDESYVIEYQNIGGIAVATGKYYPSGSYVENIANYTSLPFKEGRSYALYERVQLDNGDIVKSTINGNTNNPNVDMDGWVKIGNVYNVLTVADMLSLNLTDGDIIQVDSYLTPNLALAEPYVGGGLFKFSSSLIEKNDGGHVINGCVRQNVYDFNVENFGARLDGNVNCTSAVNKACAALQAAGGGKLTVPKGVLLWGEQDFAGATGKGYSYKGKSLFEITGCIEPVTIELNATYIKLTDGLRYGAFNPTTGLPHPSTGRFTESDYRASIGSAFDLTFNSKVMVKGAATLDFQQEKIQVGGSWGDTGIQIQSNGLRIYANVEGYAENIKILGAPLDGVYVGMPFSSGNYNYHYDKVGKVTLLNVESFKSGRQGFSHTGGFQGTFINCKFNETGMGKIASMPMAGIDIEPTAGAPCKELVFINCECAFNAGVGFLNYAKSEDVTWFGGKLIGTRNWTHWMQQDGGAVFQGTQFVGYGTYYGATSQYIACKFSDDIFNYDENPNYRSSWMLQNTQSALFKDCEYHTYNRRLVSATDSPLFDGGTVYLHDIDETVGAGYMNLGNARIKSITVKDLRVNPQSARYSSNGVFLDSLSYAETSGNFRWGSSSGQKGGYRSPSTVSNYDGGKIPSNVARDYLAIATSANLDKTTVNKIIPVSAIPTTVDESMYYKKGDLLLNTTATATSWTEALCINAGYTCNTAWAASTNVALGDYVFSSTRVYKCVVAGTTGMSAPTGTGMGIVDGTATWDYLGTKAEFKVQGAVISGLTSSSTAADIVSALKAAGLAI